MHSPTLRKLAKYEKQARAAGDAQVFLQKLGPLHDNWHGASMRRVGFLLFHWHVIAHFRALKLHTAMKVRAYKAKDFSPQGQFPDHDYDDEVGFLPPAKSLDDLVLFSQTLEGWHNEAHMDIEEATGTPMMDPRVNIFYTPFWNLHFFINKEFERNLKSYGKAAVLTPRKPKDVVKNIEATNEGWVPEV